MHADFDVYGGAMGLSSCCLYGGAPYQGQELKLRRGVDIVIGTPGRVKVIAVTLVDRLYEASLLSPYMNVNYCKSRLHESLALCVLKTKVDNIL